jgi:hypothetical protein
MIVRNGSHSLGEAFFSTRLLGNSLVCRKSVLYPSREAEKAIGLPAHVKQIENRQSDIILMVGDACVRLKTNNFRISDIRPIEKRA